MVGDVLLWTLRKVMGDEYYTPQLHRIWIKIYSRMLKVLIPAAVSHELHGNNDDQTTTRREATGYFQGQQHSMSASASDDHHEHPLESQKILNQHNSGSSVRPASKVSS